MEQELHTSSEVRSILIGAGYTPGTSAYKNEKARCFCPTGSSLSFGGEERYLETEAVEPLVGAEEPEAIAATG